MYSILINSSVQAVAKLETERNLKAILSHLQGKGLINRINLLMLRSWLILHWLGFLQNWWILLTILHKKNCLEHGMIEKAVLEILNWKELSVIATLIENIVQMTITRATIFNLLTLITPESLFAKRWVYFKVRIITITVYVIIISPNIALHFKYRYELPEEIVEEYFLQEHFALKPLISQSILPKLSKDSFYLIHTRSDISIQSLPTLSIDFKFDCDEDKFSVISKFILFFIDGMVIFLWSFVYLKLLLDSI